MNLKNNFTKRNYKQIVIHSLWEPWASC